MGKVLLLFLCSVGKDQEGNEVTRAQTIEFILPPGVKKVSFAKERGTMSVNREKYRQRRDVLHEG